MGRLIRHARPASALAVLLLPVPMVEPALRTLLITTVGLTMLPPSGLCPASRAAIALPSIAVRTDPECCLAPLAATNALPENHFAMNHPPTQADFDNGSASWQGRKSFDGGLLMKAAEPEPRCFQRRGSLPPSKPQYNFSPECFERMIDG